MNDNTITTKEMFELLRSDIQNQSSELKAQIANVKSDMQTQIANVKSDMQTQIADIQTQITDVKSDIQIQIADVKSDMQTQIADVKTQISDVKTQIADVRSDTQSIDDRLRNVEAAVAGTTAVSTYKKTLVDWLFRIAAAVGVGGAIKAFFLKGGVKHDRTTIADLLRRAGYRSRLRKNFEHF
ncbi:MAG: hypothetical protein OYL97_20960 [Candidatus Poribacteria bacterium]|nr:hypothetical protein [Candidatus Poribacteria bacterium]MDE0469524.1 hypothetical protein [Candidatus Poribacteria bacterium]